MVSVAFPALGTGVGGFGVRPAAQIMVDEVTAHLRAPSSLRTVVFVVGSPDAEQAFTTALRAHSTT